jgi:hypothetical protein
MARIEYAAELKAATPGVVSSSTAPLSDMSAITHEQLNTVFSALVGGGSLAVKGRNY